MSEPGELTEISALSASAFALGDALPSQGNQTKIFNAIFFPLPRH